MAIYLDSTAHRQLFNLRSPGVQLLVDLAHHLGQRLAVSEIAFEEIQRHTALQIREDAKLINQSRRELRRNWSVELPEDSFDPEATFAEWQKRFRAIFGDPVPVDGSIAREALIREIHGRAPARRDPLQNERASGARDTAIWLSCVRHHASEDAQGFFVSDDDDFSPERHPELTDDVDGLKRVIVKCCG